jgi:hypothetical protein
MFFEAVLQGRIGCFGNHIRQVLCDLLLGVVDILQRMHEKIVKRFDIFGKKPMASSCGGLPIKLSEGKRVPRL